MQTIRSFIAVPLAPEIRRGAVRLINRIRHEGDGIKWVPTDNLHLTLKFLGEVDNTEVPRVCDVISGVTERFEPFELTFSGTGGFPDTDRPRVLWVGIQEDTDSLVQMVGLLEKELAQLGFKPEPRDHRPHLTLGRTRGGSPRPASDVIPNDGLAPLGPPQRTVANIA